MNQNNYKNVKPYVYVGKHRETQKFYYGMRYANKVPASSDLGKYYFTSSEIIKPIFHEFDWKIICETETPAEARRIEHHLILQFIDDGILYNKGVYRGRKSIPCDIEEILPDTESEFLLEEDTRNEKFMTSNKLVPVDMTKFCKSLHEAHNRKKELDIQQKHLNFLTSINHKTSVLYIS